MTIQTVTDLQNAVIEYLARDQDTVFVARIPTFIQSAEAKFNRLLFTRQMEQRATAFIDITTAEPEFIALPTDFQSMRRMRLSSVTGKPRLNFKSGTQLDEYRTAIGDVAHRPNFFTIFGNEIEVCPQPDQDYTVEMIYRQNVPSLSLNATNWLLTLSPDLYLYATLMETAPYIKEDSRLQTWGAGFQTALDGLNALGMSSTYNAGPMVVRITGVTP
jgi:hypothetical protein